MSIPTVSPDRVFGCRYQSLEHYDQDNIAAIAADLRANGGILLNPIHLIARQDGEPGEWECIAGHDRLEAARLVGLETIPYRNFTGVVVSDEDIYSHWMRDNAIRKTIDKRAAVRQTLRAFPEWSNVRIAETVGCSDPLVLTVRTELEAEGVIKPQQKRVGKDGVKQSATKPRTGTRQDKPKSREQQMREAREAEARAREMAARDTSGAEDEGESVGSDDTAPADEQVSEGPSGSPASDEPVEEGREDSESPEAVATPALTPDTSAGSPDDDERLAYLLNAESALAHAASFRGLGMAAVQTALESVREVIRMLRQEEAA